MEITLPTLILSYLVIYLIGFGAGLLTCCRWKEIFMSSNQSETSDITVQGAHMVQSEDVAVASAPHITKIELSQ